MDTAAALGQVHMCRYLMLCSMIALTAHWTTGVPVRKIAPTPRWPLKPTPHIYVPKRFLRLWSQKQDELMLGGPSGDGPEDSLDSSFALRKTSEAHNTEDDYTIHSPLPDEILPSHSEPFPTIIDTEIETSEAFSDELISRSSVSFQGPSSLLNTLIFRPSPPCESSSAIVPTPTLESSSAVVQASLYDFSASWKELDELASSFTMSSRRALSYSPSEMYAIITAISATYIYQEDTVNLPKIPSITGTESPFGPLPSTLSTQLTERVPDLENATLTFVGSKSVHFQSSDESYFDISTDSLLYESRDSISTPRSSFSTKFFPLGISDALTGGSSYVPSSSTAHSLDDEYSWTLAKTLIGTSKSVNSDLVPISEYSTISAESSLLLWSPYSASIAIHTTSMSSDVYYFSNNTLDGSFAESQFSHKASYFIPFLSFYDTVFLGNVETTVTIIDNIDTPFTHILPTLTVTGSSINNSSEVFIGYPEDFTIIPSNYEIDSAVFNNFSTFKHLSSSFDTKARIFSTFEPDQGLASSLPHISMENMISISSFYPKNLTDLESSKEMAKTISPTVIFFSTHHFFPGEINESLSSVRMSYLSHSFDEIELMLTISATNGETAKMISNYDGVSEMQSGNLEENQPKMDSFDKYSINETKSNQYSEYNVSEYLLPSSTFLDIMHSSLPPSNESQTDFNELSASIFTSFSTKVQSNGYFHSKPTDSLINYITKQSYKPDNELSRSITSPANSTKEFKFYPSTVKDKEQETSKDSEYNFLDPFTHHVTVRSLRSTSHFDVLTSEHEDHVMTTEFETESSLSILRESLITTETSEYYPSTSSIQFTSIFPEPPEFPIYIETLFGQKSHPAKHKPSRIPAIVTDELNASTEITRPPDVYFPTSTIMPFESIYSEDLLMESVTAIDPSIQHATLYNQELMSSYDSTYLGDGYSIQGSISSTLDREHDVSEIFKQSLRSEFINTLLLDSSTSEYLEITRSFLLSGEATGVSSSETLGLETSVTIDYQITPTSSLSTFKEPSHTLSGLDNHFLESSNASSKVLEDSIPLKSIMNKSKSLGAEQEDTVLLSSFQSVSYAFTSDTYTTPSLITSSYDFHASLKENSSTIEEEPRRSYFEFHESTRILEYETILPTESSKFIRSAVYDSSEPFDSDTVTASDVEIQTVSLYPSSEFSSLEHSISVSDELLFSLSFTQDSSVPSLILPSHSEDKNKIYESIILATKDSFSVITPSSYFLSLIQQTESEGLVFKPDGASLLSTDIKSSFPEITALDMNTLRELSLSSEELNTMWPSLSFLTRISEPQNIDSLLSDSFYFESLSAFQLLSNYTPEMTEILESSSLILPDILESINFGSIQLTGDLLTSTMASQIPNSVYLLPETSIYTKRIFESDHHGFRSDDFTLTFTSLSYVSSMTTVLSPLVSKEPLSIESDFPKPLASSTLYSVLSSQYQLPPLPPLSAKELLSIKSDHPEKSILTMLLTPLLPSYVTSSPEHWQTKAISSLNIIKEPRSIETDEMLKLTRTMSSPIASHSDVLLSLKSRYETPQIHPKYLDSTKIPVPSPIASLSDALLSLKSLYETLQIYPKDISLDSTNIKFKASRYISSSVFSKLQPTSTEIKIKDPLSIESEFRKPKVTSFLQSSRSPLETSFRPMRPQFETSSSAFHHLQSIMSEIRPTATTMLISSVQTELSPTLVEGITTPEDSDTILVSILPVSSFLNINQTRNATADSGPLDDTHSEQTFPKRNTDLFKDNHYWVLTVLEAPAKGQLPENFSHIMENRLANAYSEAFRSFPSKNDVDKNSQDIITVKILSLTDDILLKQLEIVYVVERGDTLVPSAIAAEYLRSLRFEQLREFFGYHAIVKAKPYRPPSDDISRPVGSPLPVLAIVGGVLLGLLVIFCCFCVYCRCCRPKPAPSSPGSSTSGSLQRSLSKYGQHNRKHLFREMTHQLTSEMAAQIKYGSTAPDAYLAEKSAHSRRSLPTLPRDSDDMETKDPAMKILKILENKEASTSPIPGKQSRGTDGAMQSSETTSSTIEKKKPPKPKKRRKVKDSVDQASKKVIPDSTDATKTLPPESPPPTPPPKGDVSIPSAESRPSPDSGTSSRHPSSQPSEENESEGSNVELLPPVQDLIDQSKSESEAAAAETQMHLSRVRQRISELLDDAFALAGGRRLYGSLRSKKIEPATDIFPRYGSFRSHSATEGEFAFAKPPSSISIERRPISEGGQRLLGVITDEGQLITHPPPKLVWDQDQGYSLQVIERPIATEVVEARNRNINLFPFQPQRIHQLPALPSSSLPLLDTLPEGHQDPAVGSPIREAASELHLPHSTRMNPATADQYDELDVVSALRNDEPVEALIQAIKDELQKFAGSMPGANDSESNA